MDVKHRPLLYIETSVFGFYYDEEPRNALRREAVRTMFQQISLGMLDAAASPLTGEELDASAEPTRSKLVALLDQLAVLDADDAEVSRLAGLYIKDGVIPAAETLDARHAAYATVARADIIVSLNLRHLANAWAERRLNAVNAREGLPAVSIRTPEQVVHYED
jgi:hypothetical protein